MPSQVTATSAEGRGSRWSWLLPAGTFLAGCALGAVVTGVGEVGGDDEPSPSASAVAADEGADEGSTGADDGAAEGDTGSSSGEDSDLTVRVPEVCVQTADDATALIDSVDDLVAAVADLDPARLRRTVDDVQQVRDDVQDEAEQCRKAAAERMRVSSGSGSEDEGAAPATPSS